MSKRTGDLRPTDLALARVHPAPPPLSEELIAKLHKAVSAARRDRMAQSKQETDKLTRDEPRSNRTETS